MSEDDLRSDDSDGDEHEELATLLPSGSRAAKLLGERGQHGGSSILRDALPHHSFVPSGHAGGTTGAKKALSSATGGGGGGALDTGSAEDALRRHFDALQQQRSAGAQLTHLRCCSQAQLLA